MQIRNQRDFWAGVMFVLFGVAFMVFSQEYQMGSAAKMGPAYFPTVLGALLTLLGLMIALPALRRSARVDKVAKVDFKAIFVILLAIALYGLLLPTMGFVIAVTVLVVVSALGSEEFRLVETLISAAVLVVGCYAAFVWGLELQFPVWPPFLTR